MPRLQVLNLNHNQIASLEERKLSDGGSRVRVGSQSGTRSRTMSTASTRSSRSVAPHPSWTSGLSSPSGSRASSVSAPSTSPPRGPVLSPTSPEPTTSPVLPFGHVVKPTPANTLPPSYDSNHLISTNNPQAPLDELQRLRALRMGSAEDVLEEGSEAAEGEDTFVEGPTVKSAESTPRLSSDQTDKVARLARCQSVPLAIVRAQQFLWLAAHRCMADRKFRFF